ncbi:hypothetical protein [Candidatus Nephthysia bennettiae]|uniref:Uncharacterized protein n=1 Tax=Candidatus Nephthysia bennettiae TaxID=3127016 RepID=A0A934N5D4_9BACT|nr:hypothetical protein [Candidatus Dormibacteraeota bacterium]
MIDWSQVPRSCTKMVYESRKEALIAARGRAARGFADLRPYHCDCGSWHLSSQRRADRLKRASGRVGAGVA